MLCQLCGDATANVQFTEVIGSQKRQRQLCSSCAQSEGLFVNLSAGGSADALPQMLPPARKSEASTVLQLRCERCECTLAQLRQSGRVGCPSCYDVFFEHLRPLLEQVHGWTEPLPDERGEAGP
jgi:protein arginine kinase activator